MTVKDEERERILTDNAGIHVCRRSRDTGLLVSLYRCDEAGISGGAWATVCESHSTIVTHASRTAALSHLSYPLEWCSECAEKGSKNV